MGFDIDVLIVFADGDNQPGKKEDLGWVSQFKKFLGLMLNQVLGENARIMLKAEYDNMVSPTLNNVGILVTILSKDFVQSGKCADHVDSFYKAIENSSKNKNRVFKVFKSPLSGQEQPRRLRELLGYDMYQLDPDSGEITMLLSILYDPQSVELVRENIESGNPDNIAFAMELLDLFVDQELKPKLVPLFDDSSTENKLHLLQLYYPRESYTPIQVINYLLNRAFILTHCSLTFPL